MDPIVIVGLVIVVGIAGVMIFKKDKKGATTNPWDLLNGKPPGSSY